MKSHMFLVLLTSLWVSSLKNVVKINIKKFITFVEEILAFLWFEALCSILQYFLS